MLQVEGTRSSIHSVYQHLDGYYQKDEFIPDWEMALAFLKKQQDLRMCCAPAVSQRASETWLLAFLVLGHFKVQGCSTAMLPPP